DGQQEGMYAGGVDRVRGVDAGNHRGDGGAGEFVDELAEGGVFLRGAADDGEGPDGIVPVVDAVHVEHGEIVLEAVVAEVVAEGAFGQQALGIDRAADAEVGLGVDG